MTQIDIYDFDEYKEFLEHWITTRPNRGRGARAAMAKAAGCQTAYISQVLLSGAHLSLEQGEKVSQLFELNEYGTKFFLTLLQKDRAGTQSLRIFFQKQIQEMKEKHLQLKNRLIAKEKLSEKAQLTYFNSWLYSAVHLLIAIPKYSSRDAIAKRLGLNPRTIDEIINFLTEQGLVIKETSSYKIGKSRMHLPHDSPLVRKHHINWRIKAIQDLDTQIDESLHYSSAITISNKDAAKIRAILMKTIENATQVIAESPEEELYSLNMDFFKL